MFIAAGIRTLIFPGMEPTPKMKRISTSEYLTQLHFFDVYGMRHFKFVNVGEKWPSPISVHINIYLLST